MFLIESINRNFHVRGAVRKYNICGNMKGGAKKEGKGMSKETISLSELESVFGAGFMSEFEYNTMILEYNINANLKKEQKPKQGAIHIYIDDSGIVVTDKKRGR